MPFVLRGRTVRGRGLRHEDRGADRRQADHDEPERERAGEAGRERGRAAGRDVERAELARDARLRDERRCGAPQGAAPIRRPA